MAYLHDNVLDAALNYIQDAADADNVDLHICSTEPTTYADATSTYSLGSKADVTITGPADDTSGRKITVSAITDGTVSATGTAGYFALVNTSTTLLLAAQELSSPQSVTDGNTFTVTATDIGLGDPV